MKTIAWLNNEIIPNGLICEELDKVRAAKSKKQIFEVCCTAKGIDFLPMMRAKGHPLSYDVICEEFGRYINGQHKPEFKKNEKDCGYTSAIYCQHYDNVTIDTTVTCFMDCHCVVHATDNSLNKIVVDENSSIKVYCPISSRLIVEMWGDDDTVVIADGKDRVQIKRMRDGIQ